ncbi:unnamed protein product (macronuclear) [Paramecium tetraurelia]|uniref:Uncharacterized protein n=1 Tax=Paramecium tetraurelia TaxID=5888 RepID=A0CZC1_PARTE|nr:uncharacterized protein GSPATT00011711001 [Paramecium tetraurelia]CAK76138.1 unnamed protein product [Paramecium tetraurelia]|eukprot:XP_001443535.1 hypothetical protein (macronuclear) [Paramecium tetraurelia strain d4-2]
MKRIDLKVVVKKELMGYQIKRILLMEQRFRKSKQAKKAKQARSSLLNHMDFYYQRKWNLLYYYNNRRFGLKSIHKRIGKYIRRDRVLFQVKLKINRIYKFQLKGDPKIKQFDIKSNVANNLNTLDGQEVPFELYNFDRQEEQFEQEQNDDFLGNEEIRRQNDKIIVSNNH